MLRGNLDRTAHRLIGECPRDVERCLTTRAPVASVVLRPSRSSFFCFIKQMLTDVGPVELWATRPRRPSAAANPQGFAGRVHSPSRIRGSSPLWLRLWCLQNLTFGRRFRAA